MPEHFSHDRSHAEGLGASMFLRPTAISDARVRGLKHEIGRERGSDEPKAHLGSRARAYGTIQLSIGHDKPLQFSMTAPTCSVPKSFITVSMISCA